MIVIVKTVFFSFYLSLIQVLTFPVCVHHYSALKSVFLNLIFIIVLEAISKCYDLVVKAAGL